MHVQNNDQRFLRDGNVTAEGESDYGDKLDKA